MVTNNTVPKSVDALMMQAVCDRLGIDIDVTDGHFHAEYLNPIIMILIDRIEQLEGMICVLRVK
mgnify:CR=1 FL=1